MNNDNKCFCNVCNPRIKKLNILKTILNKLKPIKKQKYKCNCVVCCSDLVIDLNDVSEISTEITSIYSINFRDTIVMD
jgi:hypothetical protein